MNIQELKDKHKNQACWFVGLGPSLKYLSKDYFGPGPIICLNESVLQVEKLGLPNKIYSLQKHGCGVKAPHEKCKVDMFVPNDGIPVLLHNVEGPECLNEVKEKYFFNNQADFNLPIDELSAVTAVSIAKLFGCVKFKLLCFDNVESGNCTRIQPEQNGMVSVIYKWEYKIKSMGLLATLRELGWDYKFITPVYKLAGKMKLIIATPFYSMSGFSPYIVSLTNSLTFLHKMNCWPEYWDLSGDSYVDRARNTLCNKFLETDATDLLFIDSDMAWQVDAIYKIMQSPHSITGCAYPVKYNWEEYGVAINTRKDGVPIVDNYGYISASWVPAGFLRISRSALEEYAKFYSDEYYYDVSASPDDPGRRYTNFFRCVVDSEHRYGEDVEFCRRWKNMGGKLWIEPNITFNHCGMKGWRGNYHDYLTRQPRP